LIQDKKSKEKAKQGMGNSNKIDYSTDSKLPLNKCIKGGKSDE
jgi:hypothetical protein